MLTISNTCCTVLFPYFLTIVWSAIAKTSIVADVKSLFIIKPSISNVELLVVFSIRHQESLGIVTFLVILKLLPKDSTLIVVFNLSLKNKPDKPLQDLNAAF
eukprot:NODE_346_length_10492_cov_0.275955.p9 type:complete len:102 gc:universal NODE_346_length_10492_cov_0.275955:4549-4244(-)